MLRVILAVVFAAVGFAGGFVCCPILNKIPAKWLCDYDEEPSEELLSGERFTKKQGAIFGAVLGAVLCVIYVLNGLSAVQLISIPLCFVLTLIAAADGKYQIIPDQFTIAAAVISLAVGVTDLFTTKIFVSKWYELPIGAAVGGGILMALDIFSMVVLKKEGFGFGDVKLLAALGLMFGWKYILTLLVTASLIAAVHFLILIFKHNGHLDQGKYLPMAPYLCMGAAAVLMFLTWFNELFGLYKTVFEMDTLP